MLEYSKKVLSGVSFDRLLFRKELGKLIRVLKPSDRSILYFWCISSFGAQYGEVIREVFNGLLD